MFKKILGWRNWTGIIKASGGHLAILPPEIGKLIDAENLILVHLVWKFRSSVMIRHFLIVFFLLHKVTS